jgi:esterase/lipase superfamily enzyme
VAEVLHRLTDRPDVERVVVNSHSQGTVVAFDALRGYPAVRKPTSRRW